MTKRLKSKHKVDRRLKANIWGRPNSPFNSRAYPPGQHGQNKKGKPTDYGVQLQAKQKLKAYYGNINERQFRNIYRKALAKKGDTTENLISLLESRLDTVIYRAKFAPSVFSARQMINHGHIKVYIKRVKFTNTILTQPRKERKIIFCHYRQEIDIIKKILTSHNIKTSVIDGRAKQREREIINLAKNMG